VLERPAPRAGLITGIGASAVAVAEEVGGIVLLTAEVARARWSRRGSTGASCGRASTRWQPLVKKFGATALAGWAAGYAVLRELGPILIALMFSGRVGANARALGGLPRHLGGRRAPRIARHLQHGRPRGEIVRQLYWLGNRSTWFDGRRIDQLAERALVPLRQRIGMVFPELDPVRLDDAGRAGSTA
jgi:hypothetical protein